METARIIEGRFGDGGALDEEGCAAPEAVGETGASEEEAAVRAVCLPEEPGAVAEAPRAQGSGEAKSRIDGIVGGAGAWLAKIQGLFARSGRVSASEDGPGMAGAGEASREGAPKRAFWKDPMVWLAAGGVAATAGLATFELLPSGVYESAGTGAQEESRAEPGLMAPLAKLAAEPPRDEVPAPVYERPGPASKEEMAGEIARLGSRPGEQGEPVAAQDRTHEPGDRGGSVLPAAAPGGIPSAPSAAPIALEAGVPAASGEKGKGQEGVAGRKEGVSPAAPAGQGKEPEAVAAAPSLAPGAGEGGHAKAEAPAAVAAASPASGGPERAQGSPPAKAQAADMAEPAKKAEALRAPGAAVAGAESGIGKKEAAELYAMMTELATVVHRVKEDLAALGVKVKEQGKAVEERLSDFERRLSLGEARRALDAAAAPVAEAKAESSMPMSEPAAIHAVAPNGGSKRKAGEPKASMQARAEPAGGESLPAAPPRYRIQAASPGLAMLADVDRTGDGAAPLQIAVGSKVPGFGRVRRIWQSGVDWIVETERGVIR